MSYISWNDTYRKYPSYKWDTLRSKKGNLYTYLSLLADDNLNICLFFNGDSELISWGTLLWLVMNLVALGRFQQACDEKKDYFVVIDYGQNCV